MKKRKRYSSEKKVIILRELLENNVPISQLAEKYEIHPNDIYNWKKKLFEEAIEIFQPYNSRKNKKFYQQRVISKLESKLRVRDDAIAMLLKENIEKNIFGETCLPEGRFG